MNNVIRSLEGLLTPHLEQNEFELMGITPMPPEKDGFVIQVRPKRKVPIVNTLSSDALSHDDLSDAIYLPHGKLNVSFLLKNAALLLGSGDIVSAKSIYKAILSSGESTGVVLFSLGRCYETENKLEQAQTHYEESIAYHPTMEALKRLGAVLIRQNQNQKAAETFERALLFKDLESKLKFELHKAAGNCWARCSDVKKAEYHFKSALEMNASADEVRSNLGTLHLQNNNFEIAKRYFRDAVASNSKNAQSLAGLGMCYLKENDKKSAYDYFVQSLQINIHNATALFNLVKCAYELKSYSVAARLVKEYCDAAPINANILFSLAGLQYHLGRLEEAQATTQKILELQPAHQGAKELLNRIEHYSKR